MSLPKIVVVAGPSGCGKSKWAKHLASIHNVEVISTDDFMDLEWEDVPGAVMKEIEALDVDYPDDPYFIIEGVRALSVIHKSPELQKRLAQVWWGGYNPNKPKCEGLLTRQQNLMKDLGWELKAQIFKHIPYP